MQTMLAALQDLKTALLELEHRIHNVVKAIDKVGEQYDVDRGGTGRIDPPPPPDHGHP